jgi:surface antigen
MSEPIFSDETLMAYADGELREPEASVVRDIALRDPAIGRRIAMFKASRQVLAAAFDRVVDQPVPQRLVDAVQALGREHGAVRVKARTPRRWTTVDFAWLHGWQQYAVAASVAGLVGVVVGWWGATGGWRQDNSGSLTTQVASLPADLTDALDRLPSGVRASTRLDGGAADVLPLASYQNGDSLCREFEISRPSAEVPQAVRGVVCRDDGRWLLKAVADLKSAKARSDEYRPASGGDDLAPVLGLGRSLSQEEERRLLADGWRLR